MKNGQQSLSSYEGKFTKSRANVQFFGPHISCCTDDRVEDVYVYCGAEGKRTHSLSVSLHFPNCWLDHSQETELMTDS